ncbi:MAG: DUF1801 domain-containing protein [Spirosomataceae bacterium]
MQTIKLTTIDDYIAGFPENIQLILEELRETIRQVVPEAEEAIKYGMPTFIYKGNLVYFAAFKNHIGFYALPSGNVTFKEELSSYKTGKGSIQFPLDQPMPYALISKMVTFRVKENEEREKAKPTKKKKQEG